MAALRFKQIDHPADVGIVAYGKTAKEIFENAAFGLFSLMADLKAVEAKETTDVKVEAEDQEELLVNWLNELIFLAETKKTLYNEFKIIKLTEKKLTAQVAGEKIDPNRHSLYQVVKAATYNQLQIKPDQAIIVFDV